MMIALIFLLSTVAIAWVATSQVRLTHRRQRIANKPFPRQWRKILQTKVPYYRHLPADLQLQLKKHIQIFLDEKAFVGCDGMVINDEIRLTIASQACLLLLNRPTNYYPKLRKILVYPSPFIVSNQMVAQGGVVSEQQRVLAGESWETGTVILSWQTTQKDTANPCDGSNVVLHEFAHQLDQETGPANGAPQLDNTEDYQQWSQVLANEFERLQNAAHSHEYSLFSYYGATNPAEFFAVITEVFFERPHALFAEHRHLYLQLSHFFKLDPVNWH
ncbi:zinc-dependent peptidase [Shewanella sp. Scap07]|uniref:M90 family metallopeptidase n=1 Tax=Shewanella sp. Scap07 TaxID=2589987 RepID=UPI0021175D8E|nr:M90 family metallopeptidase [Shewanella sp. Scap07]